MPAAEINTTLSSTTMTPNCSYRWWLTSMGESLTSANRQDAFFNESLVLVVCVVAMAASVINVLVLGSRRLINTAYTYLYALAVIHALTATLNFWNTTDRLIYVASNSSILAPPSVTVYAVLPLSNYLATAAVIFTICLTVDRYIYLNSKKRRQVRAGRKQQRDARLICLALSALTLTLAWPFMFAYTLDSDADCVKDRWQQSSSSNYWFAVFVNVRFFVFNAATVVLLVVVNILLSSSLIMPPLLDGLHQVHRSNSLVSSSSLRQRDTEFMSTTAQNQAKSLTLALVLTLTLSLICEVPAMICDQHTAAFILGVDFEGLHSAWAAKLVTSLSFVKTIGYFFILLAVDPKYRAELVYLFRPDLRPENRVRTASLCIVNGRRQRYRLRNSNIELPSLRTDSVVTTATTMTTNKF